MPKAGRRRAVERNRVACPTRMLLIPRRVSGSEDQGDVYNYIIDAVVQFRRAKVPKAGRRRAVERSRKTLSSREAPLGF